MAMEALAWLAAVLVFTCFFMKTIIPLRMFAIASNLAFVAYAAAGVYEGLLSKVLPILVLHTALIPLNFMRLSEVRQLIKSVRQMRGSDLPYDFLIPFMRAVPRRASASRSSIRRSPRRRRRCGRPSLPFQALAASHHSSTRVA